MAHLIDKSALVAEIEKMLQEEYPCDNSEQTVGYHCALYELQDFLDTLEVNEVDLEKESLTWEDISIIRRIMFDYNKQIRNEMAIPKEEEYCKEVLKRFLEQKGGDV